MFSAAFLAPISACGTSAEAMSGSVTAAAAATGHSDGTTALPALAAPLLPDVLVGLADSRGVGGGWMLLGYHQVG